jgi:predicted secreted Zn-dependent protease
MSRPIYVLGIAMLAAPVAAEPLVRLHTSYYYIDGPSATVLSVQLDKHGPVGADGKRHPGRTRWDIKWKVQPVQHGITCTIEAVSIIVGIAQTLPRWRGQDRGSTSLKARWADFVESLQRHEEVHKQHGVQAGKDIEAKLRALEPVSNCEDLESRADQAAQAVVSKYQTLDATYDRETAYGRNEGATLL